MLPMTNDCRNTVRPEGGLQERYPAGENAVNWPAMKEFTK